MKFTALQFIPYGAHVLCRPSGVELASPTVANATARLNKFWAGRGRKGYMRGEYVNVDLIEGLGQRDLHAMANLPIMEPTKLYLPAGKITEDEYRQRLFDDFARAGIDIP